MDVKEDNRYGYWVYGKEWKIGKEDTTTKNIKIQAIIIVVIIKIIF